MIKIINALHFKVLKISQSDIFKNIIVFESQQNGFKW